MFGIRYIHVDLANIYARVASVADLRISYDRPVRRGDIGNNIYLFPFIGRSFEDVP